MRRPTVPLNPDYGYLFNSYYEAVGPRHPRPERGLLSRPGMAEIARYRADVDDAMERLLRRGALAQEALALVELGLNHEQQHQELILMDIKHALSLNPLRPAYAPDAARPSGATRRRSICRSSPAACARSGTTATAFAFDNEGPRHKIFVSPFRLASRLVTCGEYRDSSPMAAIAGPNSGCRTAGRRCSAKAGTRRSIGIATVPMAGASLRCRARARSIRRNRSSMSAITKPMPSRAGPASACRAKPNGRSRRRMRACGSKAILWTPALYHPRAAADAGLAQMIGDVWEWTQSPYVAYPGFRPQPGAVGEYNGKFMSNQMVLRGGCAATPAGHVRVTYRNFFPPAARWAFSGIRLAEDP